MHAPWKRNSSEGYNLSSQSSTLITWPPATPDNNIVHYIHSVHVTWMLDSQSRGIHAFSHMQTTCVCMQVACTLHAHYMHTTCRLHACYIHTACRLHAYYMHTTGRLHVYYMHTTFRLHAYYMHITCKLHAHYNQVICTLSQITTELVNIGLQHM